MQPAPHMSNMKQMSEEKLQAEGNRILSRLKPKSFTHPETVSKAIATIVLDHPFFASILLRLEVWPCEMVPTAVVNNRHLAYNPTWLGSKDVEHVVFILCHEVFHVVMKHPLRRDWRDPSLCNAAGDYTINLILEEDCKLKMPRKPDGTPEGLLESSYRDKDNNVLAMEQVYSRLVEDQEEQEDGDGDGDGEGEGEGQGQGQGQGNQFPDPGGMGGFTDAETEDGRKPDAAEEAGIDAELTVAIQQAANAAKAQGNLPASIAHLVEEIAKPQIDWRDVLRNFIQRVSRNGYNWNKPNRRHIARGLYLPARQSDQLKPGIVYFDNSGSVSERELEAFGGELNDIVANTYPCTIHTVEFDTSIVEDHIQVFSQDDYPIKLERVRCGGTNFHPIFEHLPEYSGEIGEEFAFCIICTDMEAGMPPVDMMPSCPVLWVSTSKRYSEPNFGEVAVIDY